MRIAFYSSAQDVVPRVADVPWSELAALLTTFRRTHADGAACPGRTCAEKNGPAWSPVDIVERRRNENVRAVTAAVFDLDHLTTERLEACLDGLTRRGLAWIAHSTHSNRPDDLCLRLVMPVSRPIGPREWAAVRSAAVRDLDLPADPATRDLARLYYLPDAPVGAEPLAASVDGDPLDVDALLESARAGAGAGARVTPPAAGAPPATEQPTDVHQLGALLRAHCRPENRALIGRVLRGEPFAPLGQQDNTLQTLMSTVAFCLPNDTPDDVIVHLLMPSFRATDWQDGTEHLVREALKKLHRARERKIARDEKRLAENRAIRERLGMREPQTPPAPLDEGEPDPDAWVNELITYETREGLRLKNCEANVELVLRCAPEWRGKLRFNTVKKDIECDGPVRAENLDALETEIAVWFQRSDYGRLGLMAKPSAVRECIKAVAYRNAFDPLRDYLEGLVWDGTPRINEFLSRYFGAEGDERYVRAVGAKWLISAVARALRPGCKVDTMLILEGLQGLGKSSAFRTLGAGWFSDTSIDIANKDSWALASQFWILEFAELKDVRRSDAEALKAFLSRNEDTFRPPYGRVNVRQPRRCVFVGTTNSDEYLRYDPTGYRRYWPVRCERVDLEALRRDRDQLWAEAVVRFQQGEVWWLTDEEADLAQAATVERSEDPGGPDETLLTWLLRMTPERRQEVTIDQVATEALQLQVGQIRPQTRTDIGRALKRLGYKRVQRRIAGVQTWVYRAPDSVLQMPVTAAGARLPAVTVIAGAKAP